MGSGGSDDESLWDKAKKTVEGGVKDFAKVASVGTYNPDTGGWSTDVDTAANNYGSGLMNTGATTGAAGAKIEAPAPVDPAIQEEAAKDVARKKMEDTYGANGEKAGLNSTLLGGSISEDGSVLKKKRLLGE